MDCRSQGFDYHDDVLAALDEVARLVRPGDHVAQLGDVCDPDRGGRTARALGAYRRWLDTIGERTGHPVVTLVGNHDCIDDARAVECPSLLCLLREHDAISAASARLVGGSVFLFLPWRSRAHCEDPRAEALAALDVAVSKLHPRHSVVVFCHLDVPGIEYGGERDMPRLGRQEIPQEVLDHPRVRLVLAGHIHTAQRVGKVQVVGSLCRLGFGDARGAKGFVEVEL